ncbi:MAG: hypothetical protein Q9178_002014 [Gyalolechia marmorata]
MSLRHRLSRIWGQGTDNERPAKGHSRSNSEAKVQLVTTSDANDQPTLSPRRLHKAASTTFQAFSNSLRSKAQTFYVGPSQAEVGSTSPSEPSTPKKASHTQKVWSSVRSRRSPRNRITLKDSLVPLAGPETPTKTEHSSLDSEHEYSSFEYTPIGAAPTIDTKIPRSSLEDSQDDGGDDVTTPPVTPSKHEVLTEQSQPMTMSITFCCEPKHSWPSPQMRLKEMTLVEQSCPMVADETLPPLPPSPESYPRAATELVDVKYNDEFSAKDQGVPEEQSGSATAEGPGKTSAFESHALLQGVPKDRHLFEINRKSSEDFKGVFWPAGKVLKSSKLSSTGAETPQLDIEPFPDKTDRNSSSKSAPRKSYAQVQQEQKPNGTPSRMAAKYEPTRIASAAYEADTEGKTTSAEIGMGPRDVWDTAQADRRRRHANLQSIGTSSDDDSDLGIELNRSSLNDQTLLNDRTAHSTLSLEPDQLAQTGANSSLPRYIAIEGHLKTGIEGSPKSSTVTMTRKVNSVLSLDLLRAESRDIRQLRSPPSSSRPAQYLSYDEYTTNRALRHKLHEGGTDVVVLEEGKEKQDGSKNFLITSGLDPNDPFEKAMAAANYAKQSRLDEPRAEGISKPIDVKRAEPKTYDADIESDLSDSSIEYPTSSKYARYTSTPPRSPPSASPPREIGKCYSKFYPSTGRSGSPSDENWLKEHNARVEDYIAGQSDKYVDLTPRPRLADVSMVDRRLDLRNRASFQALCQFIYQCEQQSEDEADTLSLAENHHDIASSDQLLININLTEA